MSEMQKLEQLLARWEKQPDVMLPCAGTFTTGQVAAAIRAILRSAAKSEPAPTDRQLWEMGCLTRAQTSSWSDDDLAKHVAGIRKTLRALFERLDAIPQPARTEPDLTDPVVVHANMLRGTIARPTPEQIRHLYPEMFAELQTAPSELPKEYVAPFRMHGGTRTPFHGAECPSYPNCTGGCGLGCTKEMEKP
jgi:hypothetical protein